MALAQQATPDLRDLFTVVNTIVLVVNIVLAVYIKGRFGPINEKLREHKAQIDANVLHICDIRENYLRKSRVDEELKMLDAQICSRFDKLEAKIDCCDSKIGDCRTSIAGLQALIRSGHNVET